MSTVSTSATTEIPIKEVVEGSTEVAEVGRIKKTSKKTAKRTNAIKTPIIKTEKTEAAEAIEATEAKVATKKRSKKRPAEIPIKDFETESSEATVVNSKKTTKRKTGKKKSNTGFPMKELGIETAIVSPTSTSETEILVKETETDAAEAVNEATTKKANKKTAKKKTSTSEIIEEAEIETAEATSTKKNNNKKRNVKKMTTAGEIEIPTKETETNLIEVAKATEIAPKKINKKTTKKSTIKEAETTETETAPKKTNIKNNIKNNIEKRTITETEAKAPVVTSSTEITIKDIKAEEAPSKTNKKKNVKKRKATTETKISTKGTDTETAVNDIVNETGTAHDASTAEILNKETETELTEAETAEVISKKKTAKKKKTLSKGVKDKEAKVVKNKETKVVKNKETKGSKIKEFQDINKKSIIKKSPLTKRKLRLSERDDYYTRQVTRTLLKELWTHKKLAKELSIEPPVPTGRWEDIETFKPKVIKLNKEEYDKLVSQLDHGFLAKQIHEYLRNNRHQLPKNKQNKQEDSKSKEKPISLTRNKEALIDLIIQEIWKYPKPIEIKNQPIQEIIQSKPLDIFFIVGPDGESLKWIETEANVKIFIDLNTFSFTLSGFRPNIDMAKEIIKKLTTYMSAIVDLPSHVKDDNKNLQEMMPYVQDICRTSGSFIELYNNHQIIISAQAQDNINEAQRLLNSAWMQPDQNENHIILYSNNYEGSKYCFMPIHDVVTLSMFHRNMHWHRLVGTSQLGDSPTVHGKLCRLHESESVLKDSMLWSQYNSKMESNEMNFYELGNFLANYLNTEENSNTQLEIHSMQSQSIQNIFLPPLEGTYTRQMVEQWVKKVNPTKLFLPRHQTIVQLDYIPSSQIDDPTNRLSFQFDVTDKNLQLKDFLIFKRRLLIDVMMMDW
ncbi:1402_t:CDS:10 [Diversispora eburnea]|uniref:1402_t:CDS:1 n=1 Tax=Diversispora eburnea TaxID=1213867 RepID=A0A9N8WL79_9GLOM|nr:1402_t:CDS:10 [Diversispora eburnea]